MKITYNLRRKAQLHCEATQLLAIKITFFSRAGLSAYKAKPYINCD